MNTLSRAIIRNAPTCTKFVGMKTVSRTLASIPDALEKHLAANPHREVVRFEKRYFDNRLDAKGLNREVNKFVALLQKDGFKAGDVLALWLPKWSAGDKFMAHLACAKLGVIVAEIDSEIGLQNASDLGRVLKESKAKGLVYKGDIGSSSVDCDEVVADLLPALLSKGQELADYYEQVELKKIDPANKPFPDRNPPPPSETAAIEATPSLPLPVLTGDSDSGGSSGLNVQHVYTTDTETGTPRTRLLLHESNRVDGLYVPVWYSNAEQAYMEQQEGSAAVPPPPKKIKETAAFAVYYSAASAASASSSPAPTVLTHAHVTKGATGGNASRGHTTVSPLVADLLDGKYVEFSNAYVEGTSFDPSALVRAPPPMEQLLVDSGNLNYQGMHLYAGKGEKKIGTGGAGTDFLHYPEGEGRGKVGIPGHEAVLNDSGGSGEMGRITKVGSEAAVRRVVEDDWYGELKRKEA